MVARPRASSAPSERPQVLTTYMVKQVELAVRKELDRVVRPFGLTTPQFTALSVLFRHPGLSSAQLARRAFVSPQAANEMVGALERKGMVARTAALSNPRTLEMQLTEGGRDILAACSDAVAQIEDRMLADLDAAERTTLRHLLSRCVQTLHAEERPC